MKRIVHHSYDCNKQIFRWGNFFIAISVLTLFFASMLIIYATITNRDSEWLKPEVIGPTLGAFIAAFIGALSAFVFDLYQRYKHKTNERTRLFTKIIYKMKWEIVKVEFIIEKLDGYEISEKLNIYTTRDLSGAVKKLLDDIDNSTFLSSFEYVCMHDILDVWSVDIDMIQQLGKQVFDSRVKSLDIGHLNERIHEHIIGYTVRLRGNVTQAEMLFGAEIDYDIEKSKEDMAKYTAKTDP